MSATRRSVALTLLTLALGGCQCGDDARSVEEGSVDERSVDERSGDPVAEGEPLRLRQYVLSPEAVAALPDASDGSRSGRVPGASARLIRMPPERGVIVASSLDGEPQWEADVGRLHPGAFVIDGALIVRGRTASEAGHIQPTLTAIELSTGDVRWRHRDAEAMHFGVPTGAGREVYAMRIEEEGGCIGIAVLDARTGEANDPIETSCLRFVSSAPLELAEASIRPDGEGAVVLGRSEASEHALVSLGIDGSVRWRVEAALGTQMPAAPVIVSGAVLALDRGVRAFDRESGEPFWYTEAAAQEMAVADGRVFVTVGEAVQSFEASDGSRRFAAGLPGTARSPRVHGDLLLVEADNALHALSADDGEPRWAYSTADRITSVAMTDHAVFVATSRQVLRLDLDDGTASVLAEDGGYHLIAVESAESAAPSE